MVQKNKKKGSGMFGARFKDSFVTSSEVVTSFANVINVGTDYDGNSEYNLLFAFDPATEGGKLILDQLESFHRRSVEHELDQLKEVGKTDYKAAPPSFKIVDMKELSSQSKKPINPDVFQNGWIRMKVTSRFEPLVVANTSNRENDDIRAKIGREIPQGTLVRLKLTAISYNNAAARTVGTSFKLNQIKIVKMKKRPSAFDGLTDNAEILDFGESSEGFDNDNAFDESIT